MGESKNFADGWLGVETLPLGVADHDIEQVERERWVAQPLQVATVQKLVVDDRVAPGKAFHAGLCTRQVWQKAIMSCISRGPSTPWQLLGITVKSRHISSCISPFSIPAGMCKLIDVARLFGAFSSCISRRLARHRR